MSLTATSPLNRPLTYFVQTGSSLPSGLTLSGNVISGTTGTVSADTTTNFTIGVTDDVHGVTRAFSLTVVDRIAPAWQTAAGSIATTSQNTAVNVTVTATSSQGFTITYSVTSGALPTGLSLNSSTGNISGTATAAGTANFTITASDGTLSTGRAFTITITAVVSGVTMLMHFDGTNGSTTFVDSVKSRTYTFSAVSLSTTQKVAGTASARYTAQTSYLYTNESVNDFNFTGDYTVELSIYLTTVTTRFICLATNNWSVDYYAGAFHFASGVFSTSIVANTWYNLAFSYTGGVLYCFKNGALVGTANNTGVNNGASNINIGCSGLSGYAMVGYLDELRVTVGTGRYTSAYTPTFPLGTT